jgi:hypothetical protein
MPGQIVARQVHVRLDFPQAAQVGGAELGRQSRPGVDANLGDTPLGPMRGCDDIRPYVVGEDDTVVVLADGPCAERPRLKRPRELAP